ncbi:hypothetical protein LINPERHAP1_LOCUS21296 [Linum perenne]
MCIGRQTML